MPKLSEFAIGILLEKVVICSCLYKDQANFPRKQDNCDYTRSSISSTSRCTSSTPWWDVCGCPAFKLVTAFICFLYFSEVIQSISSFVSIWLYALSPGNTRFHIAIMLCHSVLKSGSFDPRRFCSFSYCKSRPRNATATI